MFKYGEFSFIIVIDTQKTETERSAQLVFEFVQVRVELSETQRSQQQLSTQTHRKQISDIHMRMYV